MSVLEYTNQVTQKLTPRYSEDGWRRQLFVYGVSQGLMLEPTSSQRDITDHRTPSYGIVSHCCHNSQCIHRAFCIYILLYNILLYNICLQCTEVSTGMYYYSTKMSHEGPTGDRRPATTHQEILREVVPRQQLFTVSFKKKIH
jgi:hypothetical protein